MAQHQTIGEARFKTQKAGAFCTTQPKDCFKPRPSERMAVIVQLLAPTGPALRNTKVLLVHAGLPLGTNKIGELKLGQLRYSVPRAGVHRAQPCFGRAEHDHGEATCGRRNHLWKAVLPAIAKALWTNSVACAVFKCRDVLHEKLVRQIGPRIALAKDKMLADRALAARYRNRREMMRRHGLLLWPKARSVRRNCPAA